MSSSENAMAVLKGCIEDKEEFNKFLKSYLTFFLIPLIVCLMKIYKLMINLVKNMNPFALEPIYKLCFVMILFIYLYVPIKKDLDEPFGFPYSYIYIALCVFTVFMLARKIKITSEPKT